MSAVPEIKFRFKSTDKTADVEKRIVRVISAHLGIEVGDVKPESDFVTDLGADSLDVIELIMALEDEFGIEISEDAEDAFTTVSTVFDYIKSLKVSQ